VLSVMECLKVSERRACRAIEQPRSTERYAAVVSDEEDRLTRDILTLACRYGRYGCWRVTEMLVRGGWTVNHKRVERIWQREGLNVPTKLHPIVRNQFLEGLEVANIDLQCDLHAIVENGDLRDIGCCLCAGEIDPVRLTRAASNRAQTSEAQRHRAARRNEFSSITKCSMLQSSCLVRILES
jgi:hypothetical protein